MTCTDLSHRTAVRDDAQWSTFRRVAIWELGGDLHDVRNCPECGSSHTRVTPGAKTLQLIPVMTGARIAEAVMGGGK